MLGNNRHVFHAKKVAQTFQEGNTFCMNMIADCRFVPWTLNGRILKFHNNNAYWIILRREGLHMQLQQSD